MHCLSSLLDQYVCVGWESTVKCFQKDCHIVLRWLEIRVSCSCFPVWSHWAQETGLCWLLQAVRRHQGVQCHEGSRDLRECPAIWRINTCVAVTSSCSWEMMQRIPLKCYVGLYHASCQVSILIWGSHLKCPLLFLPGVVMLCIPGWKSLILYVLYWCLMWTLFICSHK